MINALVALVVAETLYRNRERWKLYPGIVFAATGAFYAAGRFPLEFLRKEEGAADVLLNPWQLAVAVLFVVFFVWLLAGLYRRSKIISSDFH